jgi:hypothetical protein
VLVSNRIYTEKEAEILGRRRVCYAEGHKLRVGFDENLRGGVQGGSRDRGQVPAACDAIGCRRCDVTFTATYPPIGQEATL